MYKLSKIGKTFSKNFHVNFVLKYTFGENGMFLESFIMKLWKNNISYCVLLIIKLTNKLLKKKNVIFRLFCLIRYALKCYWENFIIEKLVSLKKIKKIYIVVKLIHSSFVQNVKSWLKVSFINYK